MNFIRQRYNSLRNRARGMQTSLRRWSTYADTASREMREDLLRHSTPIEQAQFEEEQGLASVRLRPATVPLQTLSTWYDYVLERINEQLDRSRELLDQGRHPEALSVLNDVESRMMSPNAETLGFAFRCFRQHASAELHQKLGAIDAIIRDLYLPTIKLSHQRGLVGKDALGRTPLAYITDSTDGVITWRHHAQQAANFGRRVPIALMAVPSQHLHQPWNLTAIAHEVGCQVYSDLGLGWEIANKLVTESIHAGVSPQTAALWSSWHEVVFADVFGVLKLGPAYVSGMIELLAQDAASALSATPAAAVPPTYIRWHLMLQTLQLLNFGEDARERFNQIHMLCGDPNQVAQRFGPNWLTLVNECRAIAGLVAFSPCQKLGGARVIDVAPPFLATNLQSAHRVKESLISGDESVTGDETFAWAEGLRDTPTHVALAGLRAAFDGSADFEASRRIQARFWCLMLMLTTKTESAREREDREFAPGEAVIRTMAQQAVSIHPMQAIGGIPGIAGIPGITGIPGFTSAPGMTGVTGIPTVV